MESRLRIVFMGTPDFAVEPLRALIANGFNVVAVVTTPDKPAGRGQKLSQSSVKQFALQNGLLVLQPEKLKDHLFAEELTSLKPDLFVVVAFRMLPELIWKIPQLGTFNLHASLLPQYRGAAPINWAVINGETKTGLTTFLIDNKIDTGSILLSHELDISPDETAGELHDRLMLMGGQLVVNTVVLLASGEINPVPQEKFFSNADELKSAPKLFKDNTRIDWSQSANNVHNFIRGLSPYPAAWAVLKDESEGEFTVKIFKSLLVDSDNPNKNIGQVITNGKNFLRVKCRNGEIEILELQIAGKRNMPTKDFLQGFRGIENCRFI
jgi:methionyl-tRNA formyltransferase